MGLHGRWQVEFGQIWHSDEQVYRLSSILCTFLNSNLSSARLGFLLSRRILVLLHTPDLKGSPLVLVSGGTCGRLRRDYLDHRGGWGVSCVESWVRQGGSRSKDRSKQVTKRRCGLQRGCAGIPHGFPMLSADICPGNLPSISLSPWTSL